MNGQQMDILTVLETAAAEVRTLREQVRYDKCRQRFLTACLAVSQLRGNRVDWQSRKDNWDADEIDWKTLRDLFDSGLLKVNSSCDVLLSDRTLTREALQEALAAEAAPAQTEAVAQQPEARMLATERALATPEAAPLPGNPPPPPAGSPGGREGAGTPGSQPDALTASQELICKPQ